MHRVLPQGSQELPSHNHLPSSILDDSVQVIEPTGPMPLPLPAQAFESATASSSSAPPMFAHLVQPRPLVSVSADYLTNRSRARILSFTIMWNGVPTELMVFFFLLATNKERESFGFVCVSVDITILRHSD